MVLTFNYLHKLQKFSLPLLIYTLLLLPHCLHWTELYKPTINYSLTNFSCIDNALFKHKMDKRILELDVL